VPVTYPKLELVNDTFGLLNCGVFVRPVTN
jgi:hypothetical protein